MLPVASWHDLDTKDERHFFYFNDQDPRASLRRQNHCKIDSWKRLSAIWTEQSLTNFLHSLTSFLFLRTTSRSVMGSWLAALRPRPPLELYHNECPHPRPPQTPRTGGHHNHHLRHPQTHQDLLTGTSRHLLQSTGTTSSHPVSRGMDMVLRVSLLLLLRAGSQLNSQEGRLPLLQGETLVDLLRRGLPTSFGRCRWILLVLDWIVYFSRWDEFFGCVISFWILLPLQYLPPPEQFHRCQKTYPSAASSK